MKASTGLKNIYYYYYYYYCYYFSMGLMNSCYNAKVRVGNLFQ